MKKNEASYEVSRYKKYALFILVVVNLISCEEGVLQKSDWQETYKNELYVHPLSLWSPGEKIEVCWTLQGFDNEKAAVRDAITRSWQAYLNVEFTGWSTCSADGANLTITPEWRMEALMLGEEEATGFAQMRLDFTAEPEIKWTRCVANSLNREECIRAVSIHEFGHVLGFVHEQDRSDTPASCTATPQGLCSDSSDNCVPIGTWDEESIMSYCSYATTLSQGDIYGGIVTYGMDPALTMSVVAIL